MALEDHGLTPESLRESIEPEATGLSVRDLLGLEEAAGAEPTYRGIVEAGLKAVGVDPGSMRGTALLSWADETDQLAAEAADREDEAWVT